ncbi:hypothetical protein BU25DRAFT_426528 [Macroventuria anomochaeta]|uniref:Uncharacterized protein n=1 Tax=Macroventuria anomochaeta TaxID=301207 RepID=A0ACB6RHK4_9PLEO|nr:uncharacterized protein BU25DRAFT_426528 [Macroventuria anomochaeta]KAF2621371.1 hypothetical protein BU25DRAFT_426528 [Macroventuria anomochaeta]
MDWQLTSPNITQRSDFGGHTSAWGEHHCGFGTGPFDRVRPWPVDELMRDNEREIYCTHSRRERCSGTIWCLSPEDWSLDEDAYYRTVRDTQFHIYSRGEGGCGGYGPRPLWQHTTIRAPRRRGGVRCNHNDDKECTGPLCCLLREDWPSERDSYGVTWTMSEIIGGIDYVMEVCNVELASSQAQIPAIVRQ